MRTIQLELRAIHEIWQIERKKVLQSRTTIKKVAPYQLLVKGHIENHFSAIEKWLKKKAGGHLGKWLHAISEDLELDYASLTIRGQKARWGSCSEDRVINLNYKLLFLPADLVEHILIHELCHTRELNHSKNFWQLMATFDSNYKKRRRLLQQANKYLPNWAC